ncbi:MAG: extracellular solute-binding protein [candidate division NC10 bacterium]|nr:extracellular solute-binding protein [candidate division NC10 bacterium]
MRPSRWRGAVILLVVLALGVTATSAGERVSVNVAIGADVNVVDVHKTLLGPGFKEKNPAVDFNVVGTGTGEAASRAIYTKIRAQHDAGRKNWDIDVALVSMIVASQLVREGLLHKYVPGIEAARLVTGPETKRAFGVEVDGYVVPMFHNQIAIAYNPRSVAKPPKSFEDLVAWVKANPKKFAYNGIKGGVSGQGFTVGWVYWKTGQYQAFTQGPFDKSKEPMWRKAVEELRDFNKDVVITSGNAGTLDALNRGEIWMGAVWIDQLVAWKNEGRMDPTVTPVMISPGLPIYPLYLVVPREAANRDWAAKYIDHVSQPEVQARVIVERFGWYPGVDAARVLPLLSPKAKDLLFKDVTPDDLAKYSRQMPIGEYFNAILLAYEEIVR